jgi:hypothetical protein
MPRQLLYITWVAKTEKKHQNIAFYSCHDIVDTII